MDAAAVKFNPLPDSVGPAAQNHDLLPVARRRLIRHLIGRIKIGRMRLKLGRAGVHAVKMSDRAQRFAILAHRKPIFAHQLRDISITESILLQLDKVLIIEVGQRQLLLPHSAVNAHQILHLLNKPRIKMGLGDNLIKADAFANRRRHLKQPLRGRRAKRFGRSRRIRRTAETIHADVKRAHSLLQSFGKSPTQRHHLADGFHLRAKRRIGPGEFLEIPARNLDRHIIKRRLKAGRRLGGDVIRNLIQRQANSQQRGDLGNRKTGRLAGQGRRTRNARVHLDDINVALVRMNGELDIGAAGGDAHAVENQPRHIPQPLNLLVSQGLRGGNSDAVARMHAHWIQILNRADDDEIAFGIAHQLKLIFLPAQQTLIDQNLASRTLMNPIGHHLTQFLLAVGHAAASAAHGERRANQNGIANLRGKFNRLLHAAHNPTLRRLQADLGHGVLEQLTVFGQLDAIQRRANQFDLVSVQNAPLLKLNGQVERRLAADRWQQRIRPLLDDDLLAHLQRERLDIGRIRQFRVGHNRRRIGVDQDDAIALLLERLAGLHAAIVKFAGLANHNRPRADNHNRFDVGSFGHIRLSGRFGLGLGRRLLDSIDKFIKKIKRIMRPRRSFRMILHAESLPANMAQTRDRAVVQVEMRNLAAAQVAVRRDGKTMIMRGDLDFAAGQVHHWLIAAAVPKAHFFGAAAERQGKNLMAKTNAKNRQPAQQRLDIGDGIINSRRIARAVAKKETSRIHRQDVRRRRLGWDNLDPQAAVGHHPQDIALDAKIIDDNQRPLGRARMTRVPLRIAAFRPMIRLGRRDRIDQIRA